MKQYVVDAFSDTIFHGNQAAICVLDEWLPEKLMMDITQENNFSETAFVVKEEDKYHLRWYTPGGEINLCGHATLACAYILFNFYIKNSNKIVFTSLSGDLTVTKNADLLEMEFPTYNLKKVPITPKIVDAIGIKPIEAYLGRDLLCVFEDERIIRNFSPDTEKIKTLDGLLLHITAKGKDYDCVSRSFAPKLNVVEDSVCGSGHCHIAPYWSKKLNKETIIAYQASKRGGVLYCRINNDKIFISGKCSLYSICELMI